MSFNFDRNKIKTKISKFKLHACGNNQMELVFGKKYKKNVRTKLKLK